METGIPLLDRVIEIFPWDKSEEYKKLEQRYGPGIQDILVELILLPVLYFESINDLSESAGRNKNAYYDLLKDPKVNWLLLLQEITWYLFLSLLQIYQSSTDKSFRSRWRIRILVDDTLIRRWSLKMAGVYNIWNSIDKHFMYAQKVVFLAISVGDGKFVFPLVYAFTKPKTAINRAKPVDIVIEILCALHQAAQEQNLTFEGLRLVGDSGYTNKDIVAIARLLGLEFYGSLQAQWKFTLQDGTVIRVGDLKNGHIPARARYCSYFGHKYYRLIAFHPELGKVALCIKPYTEAGTHKLKYWVYVSTNLYVSSVLIDREHTIRWKIEQMFKTFKHTLGIRFYQGIGNIGQSAWFALTCLRFIFVQFSLKLSSRFPSLRWNIRKKKFGFSTMRRYIRNNYILDSKLLKLKRLHYCSARTAA